MSSQQRQTRPHAGAGARADRARRPNRSEVRAAERRAATVAVAPTADGGGAVAPALELDHGAAAPVRPAGRAASAAARRPVRARPMLRPIVLTREQEYAYVRADLRRLFIIAGGLMVGMLLLLFVVG